MNATVVMNSPETLEKLTQLSAGLRDCTDLQKMRDILKDFYEIHVRYCEDRISTLLDDCPGGISHCLCKLHSSLVQQGVYEEVERFADYSNYSLNI